MARETIPAHQGDIAQPYRRHGWHGPHRQGDRAAAGGLRRAGGLSFAQQAGCRLQILSQAARYGARRRHADRDRARWGCNREPDQCRSAQGARSQRRSHQHGARFGSGRTGADRGVEKPHDLFRRPRRLRREAARAERGAGNGSHRAVPAPRLLGRGDAGGDAPTRGRQHSGLGRGQAAAHAGAGNAISGKAVNDVSLIPASACVGKLQRESRVASRFMSLCPRFSVTLLSPRFRPDERILRIAGMARIVFLCLAAIGLASAALAQTPASFGDSAKAMIGAWEFSNADRDKICTVTFKNDPSPVGFKLEFNQDCPTLFPLVSDVAGWSFPDNDLLHLVDAKGKVLIEFSEVEDGIYEAPTPGIGVLFLQNSNNAGPPPAPAV